MNARIRVHTIFLSVLPFVTCVGPMMHGQAPVPAPAPAAANAGQDQANDLSVSVGKSALVDFTKPVTRVAIGFGDIAEATAVSPNEVMVNGKAVGNTSLIVWEQGGERQFFNVAVHPSRAAIDDNVTALRRELDRKSVV